MESRCGAGQHAYVSTSAGQHSAQVAARRGAPAAVCIKGYSGEMWCRLVQMNTDLNIVVWVMVCRDEGFTVEQMSCSLV